MGRRRQRQELEFGSDSFLDVIANMVGIIIILIVIAGLRVSQAPIVLPSSESPPEPLITEIPAPFRLDPIPESDPEPPLTPLPDLTEQTRQLEELRQEEKFLRERLAASQRQHTELQNAIENGKRQLSTLSTDLEGTQASEADLKRRLQLAMRSVEDHKQELSDLLAQISDIESKPLPVKRIKHTVTPISKIVESEEVHFRIADNKVSLVPMQELIERLKLQAEQNKGILAKVPRNEGIVGPVEGYNMRYLLERQGLNPVDQAQFGPGVFKIQVSSFQIEPDKKLVEEPIDQALRPGSRFFKALKQSPRDATFTFWVYPDCFESFRRVQSVMHEAGLTVAARPMPNGMPITGSPGGSRSAGQ